MDAINEELSKHPVSIMSDVLELDSESKDLMLSEYYIKYFEKFYYCYTTALEFDKLQREDKYYTYLSFKIVAASMPELMTYSGISLAQFDALPDDALPIWLTGELP